MSSDPRIIYYCREYSCGDRAAEIARKKNTEKWQACMVKYVAEAAAESMEGASLSGAVGGSNLENARAAKENLWRQYTVANSNLEKALLPASRNADLADVYRRATSGLFKDWQNACKWVETLERSAGAVVPVERFEEFRRTGLQPLVNVVRDMPNYISSRVASFDSAAVTEAAEGWLSTEWNKTIMTLTGSFEACFRI